MKPEYRVETRWPSQDDWSTEEHVRTLREARKVVAEKKASNIRNNYTSTERFRIIRVVETVVR